MTAARAPSDCGIPATPIGSANSDSGPTQHSENLAKRLYQAPLNRKRPAGEAGRFWGYYREERYEMYLYICGSMGGRWALDVPRALIKRER